MVGIGAVGGVLGAITVITVVTGMVTDMGLGPDIVLVTDLVITTLITIIFIVHSVTRLEQEPIQPRYAEGRLLHVPRQTGLITFTPTRMEMSIARQITDGRIVQTSNGNQQKVIRTWASNGPNSKMPGQRKLSSRERHNKANSLIAAVRQDSRVVVEPAVIIMPVVVAVVGAVRVEAAVVEVVEAVEAAADDKRSKLSSSYI